MKNNICVHCGITVTKPIMTGSFLIELVLWIFILPLGFCYTVWRKQQGFNFCPNCKNKLLTKPTTASYIDV